MRPRRKGKGAPQLALQLAHCPECDKDFPDLVHPAMKVVGCPDGWEFLLIKLCPWCRAYLAAIGERKLGEAGN